jgi:hypothetical protein
MIDHMPLLSKSAFLTLVLLILCGSPVLSADWLTLSESFHPKRVPLPETLTSRHALTPSMTIWKGDLYIAWTEPDSHGIQQLYIKRLREGIGWEQLGKSQNRDRSYSSSTPNIATDGKDLFLTWCEKNDLNVAQLYVKQWDGKTWEFLGSSLNRNPEKEAKSPMLAFSSGVPYLTWNETGEKEWSKLYVQAWNSGTWNSVGTGFGLESQHITQAPFLLFAGNKGHLIWAESDETRTFQIHYADLENGEWKRSPAVLNHSAKMQAFNPSLAFFKNNLFAIFQEKSPNEDFTIQLRRLTPEGWKSENSRLISISGKSFNPAVVPDHETLLIAWENWDPLGIPKIAVQTLSLEGESSLIDLPSKNASADFRLNPLLVSDYQSVYLVWREPTDNDLYQFQIRKRLP